MIDVTKRLKQLADLGTRGIVLLHREGISFSSATVESFVTWDDLRAPESEWYCQLETLTALLGRGDPPFSPGDVVRIKRNYHLGEHVVVSCEWWTDVAPSVEPYWYVQAAEARARPDPASYPPGATGIVAFAGWSGPASQLELVRRARA